MVAHSGHNTSLKLFKPFKYTLNFCMYVGNKWRRAWGKVGRLQLVTFITHKNILKTFKNTVGALLLLIKTHILIIHQNTQT